MMTAGHRTAPYLRVLILSVSLLALMAGVVGLGTLGVMKMNNEFDHMADSDVPRIESLFRVDVGMLWAQRSLGAALFASEPMARSGYIDGYEEFVDNTAEWWENYLALAEGGRAGDHPAGRLRPVPGLLARIRW